MYIERKTLSRTLSTTFQVTNLDSLSFAMQVGSSRQGLKQAALNPKSPSRRGDLAMQIVERSQNLSPQMKPDVIRRRDLGTASSPRQG